MGNSGLKWVSVEPTSRPRKCFSANTSTRSTTRTGSPCRPGSARPSRRESCSRAAWTGASTPIVGTTGRSSSSRASRSSTRSARRAAGCSASSSPAPIEAELDKQGRVMIPAALIKHGGLGRDVVVAGDEGPPGDLGQRQVAQGAERGGRERRRCCRTSCNQTRLITFPFSPRRCASSSRSSPGTPWSTRPSAPAATPRSSPPTSGATAASSRSTATRPFVRTSRASAATRACSRASCAARPRSCSTSWPTTAPARTRSCSTSGSRACRSTGPSAASRTRSTRRSTCAWTRPPS